MGQMINLSATGEVVGSEYVAVGVARLRSGSEVANAELRVPAIAVDEGLVGTDKVNTLKGALEEAVQCVAHALARAKGI
jgi:hypothetical protein